MTQSRISALLQDPENPQAIAQAISELSDVVNSRLGFGHSLDPADDNPSSVTLAGAAGAAPHNGTPDNIEGAWVEIDFAARNTAVVCNHNLGLQVEGADSPNVQWLFGNLKHSGVNDGTAAGPMSVEYDAALCTVLTDSISLVLRTEVGDHRTIGAGANAVKFRAFFVPGVEWTT